ncbi:hypothetical protein ACVRY7_08730 [Streptococcus ictaluri]|uniref:Uncharacterized protein n=1 Tax=Streptococcus ictaluri 707-05 TaxID=764299 RepID=G5K0X8_9STRE|nr:hypothetical protein [Streptococcus ictaluri]EHI70361.1 hypothetical protein STRIC_0254 [Streptococcus ictaluri 707-05]
MTRKMKRFSKVLALNSLLLFAFAAGNSVNAQSAYTQDGKIDLWWNNNGDVSKYVDYTRVVNDKDVEWTITFNKSQEGWSHPDYAIFLPKGVEMPEFIEIKREAPHGQKSITGKQSTQWFYDFNSQRSEFDKEWEKFPGKTGSSYELDKFTKIKDSGDFSRVLVEHDDFYSNDKVTWTFKTKKTSDYDYHNYQDKTAFLAGMQQTRGTYYNPSFKGELSKVGVSLGASHKKYNAINEGAYSLFNKGTSLEDIVKYMQKKNIVPSDSEIELSEDEKGEVSVNRFEPLFEDKNVYMYKSKTPEEIEKIKQEEIEKNKQEEARKNRYKNRRRSSGSRLWDPYLR